MIKIAHRGNTKGRKPDLENHPSYILEALADGYDVEIDVWFDGEFGSWWLGHDIGQYRVAESFLKMPGVWCHAKSYAALKELSYLKAHCFWHENDSYTLTSWGYIWTCNPGVDYGNNTILMLPYDVTPPERLSVGGFCGDYMERP